jgi:hypothetical protein
MPCSLPRASRAPEGYPTTLEPPFGLLSDPSASEGLSSWHSWIPKYRALAEFESPCTCNKVCNAPPHRAL